jgi:5-methylcytosine-specific restriction endonuclease McrA
MSAPYNYRWQRARLAFLRAHPLCRMCAERGIVQAATVVDHIQAHEGDALLFWDSSNWQALCAVCHNSRKQMLEQPGKVPPHASWGTEGREGGNFESAPS